MTAIPDPADSLGMQQIQRRYGASAMRFAKATRHAPGHAPAPAAIVLEEGAQLPTWQHILARMVRAMPPQLAATYLEDSSGAVREAAFHAVCAEVPHD